MRLYFILLVQLIGWFCFFVPLVECRRIVVVGDLHGDYNQSVAVFRLAGLVDEHHQWSGGDAFLVQTGDVLDVGPDDLRIAHFLMKLGSQARKQGGNVHQLLGNHELRNFRGDFRGVDPGSLHRQGGPVGRAFELSNQTKLGLYLRSRKAVLHIGPFLFMHGGFSTATSDLLVNLEKIDEFNDAIKDALITGNVSSDLAQDGLNLDEDSGPVGNPILVRSILTVKCDQLAKVLDEKFPGIQSVVVGHVPHDFDDWRLCGGRLIDIDFRMSRWKRGDPGHVAALEIDDSNWHYQLLQARMSYSNPVPEPSGKRNHFLRLSAFIIVALLVLVGLVHILGLREVRVAGRAAGSFDVGLGTQKSMTYGSVS